MRIAAIAAAAVAALAGCGGSSPPPPDATEPCWPDMVGPAKGSATLGTGRDAFEAMPDTLPLEYGAQAGFDLVANVHMTGLDPGKPGAGVLDPGNPRTRLRAFFADTGVPLNYYASCPFRSTYKASPGGGYEMESGVAVVFETCWRSDKLIGAKIRIDLELEDDTDGYAHDSKIVTATAPTTDYPTEQGTPGCIH